MSSPINPSIPTVITLTAKSNVEKEKQLNRLRNAFQIVDGFTKENQVRRFDKSPKNAIAGWTKKDYTEQFELFIIKKLVYLISQ